jgi:VCBS repeat protein/PEP-CTERM motif-containing protein
MKSQLIAVLASGGLLAAAGSASSAPSVDGDTQFGSIISITADGLFHWEKGSNSVATGNPIITGIWGGNNQGPGTVQEIGLGDIDFDGNGDILTARNVFDTTGPVTWTERNSAITFGGQPVSFNIGPATSIAMGDMDGDGDGDMVLGREDGKIIWVERVGNNVTTPSGSWQASPVGGGGIRSVDLGDLDGDGNGDIVVARPDGLITWAERAVNNITGVFTGANTTPANTIRIGNMDNDADGDIIVGRDDGFISWVERNGNNLTGINTFNAGGVIDLALGDADGDENGDIFIARPNGSVLWVEASALNQNFGAIATLDLIPILPFGATLTAIDVGDLNGNGNLDIVVGVDENGLSGRLLWLEVQGTSIVTLDPNFNLGSPVVDLKIGDVAISNLLVGDLDGDGFVGIADLNIVLSNWNQNVPPGDPLADPSGDGFVGIDDLNTVLGNWNAGTPPPPGAAVPEPATLALLTVGAAAMLGRRR